MTTTVVGLFYLATISPTSNHIRFPRLIAIHNRKCVHLACSLNSLPLSRTLLTLSFYLIQDRNPKESISISHLNVTLEVPGMENRSNAMLIAYHSKKARKTRNIFVYAEDGEVHRQLIDMCMYLFYFCLCRKLCAGIVLSVLPKSS